MSSCTKCKVLPGKFLVLLIIFTQVNFVFSQQNTLRFQHLTVEDGLSQNTIQGITQDKYGFMWFGTWNGLCKYDGYKFTTYRNEANRENSLADNRIHLIYKDLNDVIWVSFSNSKMVCRYNYETDDFTRFPKMAIAQYLRDSLHRPHRYSYSTVITPEYKWEIDKYKLLTQTHMGKRDEIAYKVDPLNPWAINDEAVNDLYLDNNEVLWVGTYNIGINKADTKQKKFYHYNKKHPLENSLNDNIIRAICEDQQGNIWVGTRSKGVTKMDRGQKKYWHYTHNDNDTISSSGLISNNIRKIYCDKYGFIWIGTKDGLSRFNPRNNRFYNYTKKGKNKIPNEWVYAINEDSNGHLWIGTGAGICKYDRKRDRFYTPQITFKWPFVRVIIEDKEKNLWVGAEGGGVMRIRRDSSAGFEEKMYPTYFINNPKDPNSLSSDAVFAMIEDEEGILWIGTNNGLNRFDPKKNRFTLFSLKEGLPDVLIVGLLSDNKGHIWISHKKGLTRLDTKNYTMKHYTLQEGLQSNEFSEGACFRNSKTGEMLFGGINGFNSFFPDSIKDNPYPPGNVFFTDLKILNTSVRINQSYNDNIILSKPIYLTREITLAPADKSIAIEFAALHYANPKGNKYAYMLQGFDKDWIYTDASNRIASYSNLDPKTYVLKVKAANSDGIWNNTPTTLKIIVLPPIWKTAGAYVFYCAVLILILFLIYNYVVGREKMKNQILLERIKAEKVDELNQVKLKFFTSISHEFRTPLCLIIDPLNKMINEDISQAQAKSYYTIMARNANRLLKLVTQLLDFRKAEGGYLKLEATYEDIVHFARAIVDTFYLHAAQRNISLNFESSIDTLYTLFDSDKIDKVLYNLISNAFKYTPDYGKITISIKTRQKDHSETKTPQLIEISIKDNGIGIDEESVAKIFDVFYMVEGNEAHEGEGTGIGLALTKELVNLHHGEIKVESKAGQGSCFTVLLPFGDKYPSQSEKTSRGEKQQKGSEHINMPEEADYNGKENKEHSDPAYAEGSLVLLIEDNKDLRNYIRDELKEHYQIIDASDGVTGFEKATELTPTLIISDIMMPGMDGIELCKKLKTDERTSHIPVILLSARHSTEYKVEGYETGADAYLTKPFSSDVLKARVKNLIESRRKLRERFGKSIIFNPKGYEINVTDEAFINKARKIVEENISDIGFDGETFAEKLKMSRSQVYRKIKALTNQTVHDFITTIKLNKAAELLLTGELSIAEVGYKVGYTEPTNFRRSFIKQFGQSPKNYILSLKEANK